MAFKIDIRELDKYAEVMANFPNDFQNFLKNFLIEMANRVIAKTKPKTPVDTGSLRNAWGIETEKSNIQQVEKGGRIVHQVVRSGDIVFNGKEISLILSNPMEYATEIEYGHRIVAGGIEVGWYEGRFMLKTSIDEINAQMPLRYQKEFKDFCKERGID